MKIQDKQKTQEEEMNRLTPTALAVKCTSVILAAALLISPFSIAQSNGNTSESNKSSTDSASGTNSNTSNSNLTYTAQNGDVSNTQLAQAGQSSSSNSLDALQQTLAEPTNTQEQDKLLADSSSSSNSRRQDPAFTTLPVPKGTVKIRRQFKLFAKEELIHNLSFRDTPIREVIGELARRGNLNILLDRSVFGKITGDLHDVTLNEAMDSVLATAGLQSRVLDNNSVIVGSPNALAQLGLNRSMAKVFKLSYANAFDIANLLFTSVFNNGMVPDYQSTYKSKNEIASAESPKRSENEKEEGRGASIGEGGVQRQTDRRAETTNSIENRDENIAGTDYQFSSRLDSQRTLKGTSRVQIQEGTGFNNAAQDPGTQQIRANQEVAADYVVEQNGGRAIVIPDNRNRQVIVVGTPEDIQIAEECIRLIDKRPRMIHIQASLVELTNSGIRQLGASLNLQGTGASAGILGGSGAPLISSLFGLGSGAPTTSLTNTGTINTNPNVSLIPAGPNPLLGTFTSVQTATVPAKNAVAAPLTGYQGLLGGFFPQSVLPTVAGVAPLASASTAFNYLGLSKRAGGSANVATTPAALNFTLNMLLQQNKAKILANPSVTVSDNTEALVTVATEVIHKVTSTVSLGVTNVNVELTKAGVFLDILPKVTEDGFVTMRIRPQVSTPGAQQTFANQQVIVTLLSIREIMAQEIRIKDGQTIVLGGLFQENEQAQIAKVPYLAETPLFGALFRNTLKGRQRNELILMITPKIVEDQPDMPPLAEKLPATNM